MGRRARVLFAVSLAALCIPAAGVAQPRTQYDCTITMHLGHYSWGVIFDGSSRAKIRFGCVAFAAGAKGDHPRLQWGIHHPAAWVIVAEYIHPALKMDAVMIAPPSEADVIFRVMNKAVFTSRGWIFVKRG